MNHLYRVSFIIAFCIVFIGLGFTTAQAVPVNDNFADAALIDGETGTTSGDNIDATPETGEPSYPDSGTDACSSVWYQWTPPSTGEYFFNTFGSDFDTILAVYTGSAVDSLTPVNDNDDYVNDVVTREQSRLSIPATAGTTYYLAVDGYACAEGGIALNWGLLPANDNIASASGISGSTGTITGTNINATPENLEPIHHANNDAPYSSIWFAWTAPAGGGDFIFDTFGSDFDTILAVYSGPGFGSLTQLASNDDEGSGFQSRVAFTATGSEVYHIAVDGYQGLQGSVALNWQELAQLPPNDDFASATNISGETGTANAYNFFATTETGEPYHGENTGPYKSIWFAWIAPSTNQFAFDTFGSDLDTTMAVYTGTAVNSLAKQAENDDAGAGIQSSTIFSAVSGTTYHIAVDGFEGAEGNVILNWGIPSYTISASAGTNGSLDVSTPSPQTVIAGTTVSYTFNADTGYHVSSISGCDINYTNTNPSVTSKTEVTSPASQNCTISGVFTLTCYEDSDQDGYGSTTTIPDDGDGVCETVDGESTVSTDCNDSNASVNPGGTDDPGDDIDENCSDFVRCYNDADNDGYGTTTSSESTHVAVNGIAVTTNACDSSLVDNFDNTNTDCNDLNANVNPGELEVCDGLDNNCNTSVDDGLTPPTNTLQQGVCNGSVQNCTGAGGWADDYSGIATYEAIDETTCDTLDNDCDSSVDETLTTIYYLDADTDLYGNDAVSQDVCAQPAGYVLDNTDCDDTNQDINPGTTEICDSIDNNCDTQIDENKVCSEGFWLLMLPSILSGGVSR